MKYINKTGSPPRLAALLFGAALLGLVSQSAMAANNYTPAGTTISNTATVNYSVGSTAQTPITSSATTFKVDNKVNVTVAKTSDNSSVNPGTSKQAVAFTVTNNGNAPQRFALSAVTGAGSITGGQSNVAIYLDNNGDGAWDAGDTLYSTAATFGDVAPDSSLKILIVADTALSAKDGEHLAYSLLAQTVDAGTTTVTAQTGAVPDDPNSVDVVFADASGTAASLPSQS